LRDGRHSDDRGGIRRCLFGAIQLNSAAEPEVSGDDLGRRKVSATGVQRRSRNQLRVTNAASPQRSTSSGESWVTNAGNAGRKNVDTVRANQRGQRWTWLFPARMCSRRYAGSIAFRSHARAFSTGSQRTTPGPRSAVNRSSRSRPRCRVAIARRASVTLSRRCAVDPDASKRWDGLEHDERAMGSRRKMPQLDVVLGDDDLYTVVDVLEPDR